MRISKEPHRSKTVLQPVLASLYINRYAITRRAAIDQPAARREGLQAAGQKCG
jgi:hypothetical protein